MGSEEGLNADLVAERRPIDETNNDVIVPFGYLGISVLNNALHRVLKSGRYPRSIFRACRWFSRKHELVELILVRERVELSFSFPDLHLSTADGVHVDAWCVVHLHLQEPFKFVENIMQDRSFVPHTYLKSFFRPRVRDALRAFICLQNYEEIAHNFNVSQDLRTEFEIIVRNALLDSGWELERIQDVRIEASNIKHNRTTDTGHARPFSVRHRKGQVLALGEKVIFIAQCPDKNLVQLSCVTASELRRSTQPLWRLEIPTQMSASATVYNDNILLPQYDGYLRIINEHGETKKLICCGSSIRATPLTMETSVYVVAWQHTKNRPIGSVLTRIVPGDWTPVHSNFLSRWQVHCSPVHLDGWIFALDRKGQLYRIHPYQLSNMVLRSIPSAASDYSLQVDSYRGQLLIGNEATIFLVDTEGVQKEAIVCPEQMRTSPLVSPDYLLVPGHANLYRVHMGAPSPRTIKQFLSLETAPYLLVTRDRHRCAVVYHSGQIRFIDLETDTFHDASVSIGEATPTAAAHVQGRPDILVIFLSNGDYRAVTWFG